MSPIPPYPVAAGSGPVEVQALQVDADVSFLPTNFGFGASDPSGTEHDLIDGVLTATITNPSADKVMRVHASAFLPNLNVSPRNAGNAPVAASFEVIRYAQLIRASGGDVTDTFADADASITATAAYIAPALAPTWDVDVPAGGSVTFTVEDRAVVTWTDVAIDHVNIGTHELGSPARARLTLQGTLVQP